MILDILVSLSILASSTFDPNTAAQEEADRQYHAAQERALICVPSFDYTDGIIIHVDHPGSDRGRAHGHP